jgi:spore cortex formation protein SpoVR/YcgB (stage V sporulation)
LGIGIEFADQRIPVFFRRGRKVGDKGFDQLPAGAAECRGAAEIRGISFYEIRVEVVLANQKTELIAEPGLPLLFPFPLEG